MELTMNEIDNCVTFEEGEDSAFIHVVPLKDWNY